jgi:hypothetical protein
VHLALTEEQLHHQKECSEKAFAATSAAGNEAIPADALRSAVREVRGASPVLSNTGLKESVLALAAVGTESVELGFVVLADFAARACLTLARQDHNDIAVPLSFGLSADADPNGLTANPDPDGDHTLAGNGIWLVCREPTGVVLATARGRDGDAGAALVETVLQPEPRDVSFPMLAPPAAGESATILAVLDSAAATTARAMLRTGAAALLFGIADALITVVAAAAAGVDTRNDRWQGQGLKHRLADIALNSDAAWLHLFDAVEDPDDAGRIGRCSALSALAAFDAARSAAAAATGVSRSHGDRAGLALAETAQRGVAALDFVLGGTDRLLEVVAAAAVGGR